MIWLNCASTKYLLGITFESARRVSGFVYISSVYGGSRTSKVVNFPSMRD